MAKRAIIVLVLFAAGCGGGYADYLQMAIDAKRAACAARESMIVEREGTTIAQDKADLEKIRLECDAVFKVLERLSKEAR